MTLSLSTPLHIAGAGAVTSVGFSLPATAAAIRAGVDNFQNTHYKDDNGQAIVAARIIEQNDEADAIIGGTQQLLQWVSMALYECIANTADELIQNVRIILLLPESSRPSITPTTDLLDGVQAVAEALLGQRLESVQAPINMGSIGCLYGLQAAEDYLASQPNGAACLLAIDSWVNIASIEHALSNNRLLTTNKADGFIPGEAVAAVLITPKVPSTTHLQITGTGLGEEAASLPTEKPCFGIGLGKAINTALQQANLPAHRLDMRLANINGEEYFFDESAYAWSRVLRKPLPPHYQFLQPATRVGDVGAAFGPLLLGYSLHLAHNKRHPGQNTLIQLSSADTARGAIVTQVSYQKGT